ncbi:ABC transporter ATP-binding protein [Spirillospora sp. NPDC029432]|uniref:ABC transporter ATP-binding protein n=1 Tax=Spirillospora sp. NPDC029432 TaxID=3154599 RepID=UPI0034536D90
MTAERLSPRAAREAAAVIAKAAPLRTVRYLLLMVAEAAVPVVTIWATKLLVDTLARNGTAADAFRAAAMLAATGLVLAVLPQYSQYLGAEIGRATGLLATERLFAATGRFTGLGRFEDPVFLDRLRLAQQATVVCNSLLSGVFAAGRGALTTAGLTVSLIVISPAMTAIVLVSSVPMLIAQLRLSRGRAGLTWRLGPVERREMMHADLLTGVGAAKEIRLFGMAGFLRTRLLADRRTADAARRALDRRELAAEAGLALLGALVAGIGLAWAVAAARRGEITVGDVTLFVGALTGVQVGLNALLVSFARVHEQLLRMDHYAEVVRAGPDLPVPARPRPAPPLRHGIELDGVWFRYSDGHPWILRGVDAFLPYRGSVALVGANGAGKSTLVKLLCRFYDPTRGAIRWDGTDLREMDPAELRERISAVFQDHANYDLSAAENVGVGDVTAMGDLHRIRAAARRAGVDGLLRDLPEGYDTLLTRMFFGGTGDGVVLSGGQWQRVALARAFMRGDRDLMILDEPSSVLDAAAEAAVHAAVRDHRAGRTSLLISHRLNTVRDADVIVVLDDGVIAESGSHDELMAAGGRYARLFRLQAAGFDGAGPPPEPAGRPP